MKLENRPGNSFRVVEFAGQQHVFDKPTHTFRGLIMPVGSTLCFSSPKGVEHFLVLDGVDRDGHVILREDLPNSKSFITSGEGAFFQRQFLGVVNLI